MSEWIPDISAIDDIATPLGINGSDIYYNVYRGQDGIIDYNNPVAQMLVGDSRVVIPNQSLPANTIWHYVRRQVRPCCGKESQDSPVCIIVIDANGDMIGLTPNPPIQLTIEQLNGGAFRIRWVYYTDDQESAPTGFNVYADSGLGFVLIDTVSYQAGQSRYSYDSQAYPHLTAVKWLVKSYLTNGGESINAGFAVAVADAQGPSASINMIASYEEF